MARNLSNNTCSILKVEIHSRISVQYNNIFFFWIKSDILQSWQKSIVLWKTMKYDNNHHKVKCRAQWESNTVVRHSAGVWIPHWNTILLKAEKMVCTLRNISIERKVLYLVERKQGTLHFRLFFKIFFRFNQKLEYRFEVFTCDSVNIQMTHLHGSLC